MCQKEVKERYLVIKIDFNEQKNILKVLLANKFNCKIVEVMELEDVKI